jgi:methyltransferase-like protein/SAM-dependent methyltransferase
MATGYDRIPYPRHSYAFTHPDRLATLATLHGMSPRSVDRCRVLELGCASGSNVIPMAYALPNSEFVGIDSSLRQMNAAREFARAIGLSNLRLATMDLRAIDEGLGAFDYIIAHGVHSWCPPDVQEAIMRICGRLLSEQGVALVSYNAYPGCHLRQMIRGMAQFHVRDIEDPIEQVEQLRALIRFLGSSLGDELKLYRQVLDSESERTARLGDAFLYHDILEPTNLPVYFEEFIEQSERHGLQYLTEALSLGTERTRLAAVLRDELGADCNLIEFEQHLDFLDGTAFRRTLICRDSIRLNRDWNASPLEKLLVASQARLRSCAPNFSGSQPEEFAARNGAIAATICCDTPIGKAALMALADAFPRAMPLDEVVAAAANRLGRSPTESDHHEIRALVIGGFEIGATELHTWQPTTADGTSSHPEASPIARYELTHGNEVTNLWHERILLGGTASRHLLAAIDGRHDRNEIAENLALALSRESSDVQRGGSASHTELRAEIEEKLDSAIAELARAAVLIR